MKEAFYEIKWKIGMLTAMKEELYKRKDRDELRYMYEINILNEVMNIISEVEAEYGNGWITERMPTEEECGDFRRNWFLTTVDANGLRTIPMQCEYTTVRGKEVSRWIAYGRISPWEVIAWMPLPSPYKPTTD